MVKQTVRSRFVGVLALATRFCGIALRCVLAIVGFVAIFNFVRWLAAWRAYCVRKSVLVSLSVRYAPAGRQYQRTNFVSLIICCLIKTQRRCRWILFGLQL